MPALRYAIVLALLLIAAPLMAQETNRRPLVDTTLLTEPTVVGYYTFDRLESKAVHSQGQGGDLLLAPIKKADNVAFEVIEGRTPDSKAIRLDRGFLAGPAFTPGGKAFSVEAWIRISGSGSVHGDSVVQGGTLFSVGSGYFDGFRVTYQYPEGRFGFELGGARAKQSLGIHTPPVSDRVWRHLVATWDGSTMRLYVDGFPVAAAAYSGDYFASKENRFRIGFAGYGWGSVALDIDELVIRRRALSAQEALIAAYRPDAVPAPVATALETARLALIDRKPSDTVAVYSDLTKRSDLPRELAATVKLRMAEVLIDQGQASRAGALTAEVYAGAAPRARQLALGLALRLARQGRAALPPADMEALLKREDLDAAARTQVELAIARAQRDGNQPGAAERYLRLLKSGEMTASQRCDVCLELGHLYRSLDRTEDAAAQYRQAMALADSSPAQRAVAGLHLATCLTAVGRAAESEDLLKKLAATESMPATLREEAARRLSRAEEAASRRPPADLPQAGLEVFVSPQGNDTNSGTREAPLLTLEAARDRLRAQRKQSPLPRGGATIWLAGGDYPRTRTFELSAEDSGTADAPIVYRALPGQRPQFLGGRRLTAFSPLADAAILARLPEAARGKVVVCDLKQQGDQRLLPLRPRGYGMGPSPMLELFVDGQPLRLARWPNEGFATIGKVAAETNGRGPRQFGYDGDRPQRWRQATDAMLYGYWFHLWAEGSVPLELIDTEKKLFTIVMPPHYGIREGYPYFAFNLLEELDQPGEYYLDRNTGKAYLYPPTDLAKATVEVSLLDAPMVSGKNLSHVTFEGLCFALAQTDGLVLQGGEGCLLAGCRFERLAGTAVQLLGGRGHGLFGCRMATLGRGGAVLKGGDRRTLTSSQQFMENCEVADFSRIDRTYTPAAAVDGVGMRIVHNHFHHSPGHAMRVEGNEHRIEFNEIDHVVTETDDQGGLDMWGNPTYRGVVLRYNYWHDIASTFPCGQAGIRLDDAISGILIQGNVFFRSSAAGFGGVQIHGGKENVVDGNVFVECHQAISFSPWSPARWNEYLDKIAPTMNKAADITQPPYSTRYPALAHLRENPNVNSIWRNTAIDCGTFMVRDRGVQDTADNTVTTCGAASADGRLPWNAIEPVLRRAGTPPIPFRQIGNYDHPRRAAQP